MNLDAQQRQMIFRVNRLGFGPNCKWLLCRHKYITFREAKEYLIEIEQEEARRNAPVFSCRPLDQAWIGYKV